MAVKIMVLEQSHVFEEKGKIIRLFPLYTKHTVPPFPVPHGAESFTLTSIRCLFKF